MTGAYLKLYKSLSSALDKSYRSVVEQISTKFDLEYLPTLYVIPFVVERMTPIPGTSESLKVTYFNFTTVNANELSRLAIYTSVEFLRKFPNYVRAGLGHELAHIIVEKEAIREFPTRDLDPFRDPTQEEATKEIRKDEIVEMFPEPLRAEILEWDGLSRQSHTMFLLCRDALVVDFSVFDSEVFDGMYDDILEKLRKGDRKTRLTSLREP